MLTERFVRAVIIVGDVREYHPIQIHGRLGSFLQCVPSAGYVHDGIDGGIVQRGFFSARKEGNDGVGKGPPPYLDAIGLNDEGPRPVGLGPRGESHPRIRHPPRSASREGNPFGEVRGSRRVLRIVFSEDPVAVPHDDLGDENALGDSPSLTEQRARGIGSLRKDQPIDDVVSEREEGARVIVRPERTHDVFERRGLHSPPRAVISAVSRLGETRTLRFVRDLDAPLPHLGPFLCVGVRDQQIAPPSAARPIPLPAVEPPSQERPPYVRDRALGPRRQFRTQTHRFAPASNGQLIPFAVGVVRESDEG
mmetsp:Transcript_41295/g.124953  ORF Transcript_41295/g.124953 Transcript_41295/m.124953 type:complete len:308 (-) Transcript_41295:948-1871(-)